MGKRKYEKYIVTELKTGLGSTSWHGEVPQAGKGVGGRVLYLDSEVVPGGHYADTLWILPDKDRDKKSKGIKAHKHDYDEILAFFGTDNDNPYELNAELTIWLEDEEYFLTKACMIFIPANMQHCPLTVRNVTKPVFHFSTSTLPKYF